MWLLDHNIPRQVHQVLTKLGIENATTKHRGWENLKNGILTKTAYDAGVRCILTLDRLFRDDAASVLKTCPDLTLVLLTLEQDRGPVFAEQFLKAWQQSPILLRPGYLVEWPGKSLPPTPNTPS